MTGCTGNGPLARWYLPERSRFHHPRVTPSERRHTREVRTRTSTRNSCNRRATAVKPTPWIRVVEADTVPRSDIGPGNKRLIHPDGGSEPLGNRIIEVPEDEEIVLYRDPSAGFVAYVPNGSIARGKELATRGGSGTTVPCGICHGRTLQGLGEVPAIAGHLGVVLNHRRCRGSKGGEAMPNRRDRDGEWGNGAIVAVSQRWWLWWL